MGWTKFARDRHKLEGKWVKATAVEKVAGVIFRYADAKAYASAAKTAEEQGRRLEQNSVPSLLTRSIHKPSP